MDRKNYPGEGGTKSRGWGRLVSGIAPRLTHRLQSLFRKRLPAPGRLLSPGQLMIEFESLGDNCEFGLVQRYCGAEPLGLFRFSFAKLANLRQALMAGLEGYGDDDDLEVYVAEGDSEIMCRSRRYADFVYHTETYATKTAIDKVRTRELKKLAFLKSRLLLDLQTGDKILVRKGQDSERAQDIRKLAKVLRKLGPNVVLWVVPADAHHLPGHVEIVGRGLLKGYISHFAPYENAHDIDMECWLAICRRAYQLGLGKKGHVEDLPRLPANTVAANGDDWQACPSCRLSLDDQGVSRLHCGQPVTRLTLAHNIEKEAWLALKVIDQAFEPRTTLVFSAWVWVPESFRGTMVGALFTNVPVHFPGFANLTRRNAWQRVWASAKVSKAVDNVVGVVRACGRAGDFIFCTAWQLEIGWVPNELSIPADSHEGLGRLPA